MGARLALAVAVAGIALAPVPAGAEVAYTFKHLDGYADLDLTFSYDPVEEKRILAEIGPVGQGGHVLLWWMACSKTVAIYRPFTIGQGSHRVKPVLCVNRVYSCDPAEPSKGNVFRGYLFLEKGFDLRKPIVLTLGNRTMEGTFQP